MYGYLRCPSCGGLHAERSRTRGVERLLKHFTALRPYRCGACGWRAWCAIRDRGELGPRVPLLAWVRSHRPTR